MQISISTDQVDVVSVAAADAKGNAAPLPATPSAATSDPAVFTASVSGSSVTVTQAARARPS